MTAHGGTSKSTAYLEGYAGSGTTIFCATGTMSIAGIMKRGGMATAAGIEKIRDNRSESSVEREELYIYSEGSGPPDMTNDIRWESSLDLPEA